MPQPQPRNKKPRLERQETPQSHEALCTRKASSKILAKPLPRLSANPSTTTPECLTEIFRGFLRENRPESSQGSTYGELGMYACLLRHSSPFLAFLPSRSVSAQRSSRSRCPFHVFLIIALNTIYSLHSLLCTGAPANT